MSHPVTFRLMIYNILNGGAGRETALLEVIRAAAPDVVVVAEVMQSAILGRIAGALNMVHCIAQGSERERKVGLLSRLPILTAYSFRPWRAGRHCLQATIRLPNAQPLTIYGVHLVPFPAWFFEIWRRQELRGLLAHIQRTRPGPHLLAGDFNAIAPGDQPNVAAMPLIMKAQTWFQINRIAQWALQSLFETGYVDCFRNLHPTEDGFTLPPAGPHSRLDYIFADPLLSHCLRTCQVVTTPEAVRQASDHLPVLAEFECSDEGTFQNSDGQT